MGPRLPSGLQAISLLCVLGAVSTGKLLVVVTWRSCRAASRSSCQLAHSQGVPQGLLREVALLTVPALSPAFQAGATIHLWSSERAGQGRSLDTWLPSPRLWLWSGVTSTGTSASLPPPVRTCSPSTQKKSVHQALQAGPPQAAPPVSPCPQHPGLAGPRSLLHCETSLLQAHLLWTRSLIPMGQEDRH